MSRSNHYLQITDLYKLEIACEPLVAAFGDMPYLVGSALTRPDYRDVDVRVMLNPEHYRRLFPGQQQDSRDPWWILLCRSISVYLQQMTGLPVDFQVQDMEAANAEYPRSGRRIPLGMRMAVESERSLTERMDDDA